MQTFNYDTFIRRHSEETGRDELSILLTSLPKPTPEGPWIAGGSVRRMITDGKMGDGDVDYFFKSQAQFHEFCMKIRTEPTFKILDEKVNPNNQQWTLKVPASLSEVKVQAINFDYFENVERLLANFDFTVCQFAYDGTNLHCGDFALWDLARKRIVINNVRFPIATLRHMLKYNRQGFFACGGALTDFIRKSVEMGPQAYDDKYKYID